MCVYGSPKVIGLLAEFERGGAVSGENMPLVAAMVVAMREDVKAVAGVPSAEDLGLILFGPSWRSQQGSPQ